MMEMVSKAVEWEYNFIPDRVNLHNNLCNRSLCTSLHIKSEAHLSLQMSNEKIFRYIHKCCSVNINHSAKLSSTTCYQHFNHTAFGQNYIYAMYHFTNVTSMDTGFILVYHEKTASTFINGIMKMARIFLQNQTNNTADYQQHNGHLRAFYKKYT